MTKTKEAKKTEGRKLCMFCGGIDTHTDPQMCLLKGAVCGALMSSMKPFEAMFIMDRTPFLSILEKNLTAVRS